MTVGFLFVARLFQAFFHCNCS